MNIEDFTGFEVSWEEIFRLQKDLMLGFEPQLKYQAENFDIDSPESQRIFREFCWRITEELTESMDADVQLLRGSPETLDHIYEELVDGLNFLIELMLLTGQKPDPIYPEPAQGKNHYHQMMKVIYDLGMAANKLKNRDWRQAQYMVDLYLFSPLMNELWSDYIQLFALNGIGDSELRRLWSRKYQVNQFRLKTKY